VKLLLDQNLSPRLPRLLSDLFPGSVHVREVGLRDADDIAIWNYARENGFIIVSKDSDFQQQSLLLGQPPKFIWLRVGNCPARRVYELLTNYAAAIDVFGQSMEESHLMLP
jgi:predicted nuclease of predicted toxin-antitoxin system